MSNAARQIDWTDPPPIVGIRGKHYESIEAAFTAFHEANPHILDRLVQLTHSARQSGRKHMGIRMLWERLRWDYFVATSGIDFKLNDHYHSRYVRLIVARHPELADMFELRGLRAP